MQKKELKIVVDGVAHYIQFFEEKSTLDEMVTAAARNFAAVKAGLGKTGRKNRVVKGGVYTLATGGKTTGKINLVIEHQPAVIYLPLEDLIGLRDDINASLAHYMRRMETTKND